MRWRRTAIAALERASTGRTLCAALPEPIERGEGFSRLFDRERARSLMREAGELMAARAMEAGAQRRVELLRLRLAEGLPIRAIAEQWKADADAAHRAHARAREESRICLREVVARHAVRIEADLDAECGRLCELVAGGQLRIATG
jgi:hypothetical protein